MKNIIAQFQKAYYDGNPQITDDQYDALIAEYGEYETDIGNKGDIPHLNPMYSLQKFYPGRGDVVPATRGHIESKKLDGAAIELVYKRVGEDLFVLDRMATRGNVEAGTLIDHRKHVQLGIPSSFEYETDEDFLQVTGEVVTTIEMDNARNVASGKLNLDDYKEFCDAANALGLKFFAYNITVPGLSYFRKTYGADIGFLESSGFEVVHNVDDYLSANPTRKINFDGTVYRLNDNTEFYRLGFTAKFPRGAFAVKEDKDFVVTTLIDVEWNTGRTGKVVPKAIIETVEIEGAKVSRATLNNPKFIEAMGLYKGCKVKIIRSGEIIPCIIGLYE